MNPTDLWHRTTGGLLGTPVRLGWDVSGVVQEVGLGVTWLHPGDEVFGMPRLPRGEPGQRVLIHAAAGGVGHLAVQIAKARGAYVIGTASAAKHDLVRGLGADEMVDYTAVRFEDVAADLDVVVDPIGGEYGPRSLSTLRPGGILVALASPAEAYLADEARRQDRRAGFLLVQPDHAGLRSLAELVERGQLRVVVDSVVPLDEVAAAHERVGTGRSAGKVVLAVSGD